MALKKQGTTNAKEQNHEWMSKQMNWRSIENAQTMNIGIERVLTIDKVSKEGKNLMKMMAL